MQHALLNIGTFLVCGAFLSFDTYFLLQERFEAYGNQNKTANHLRTISQNRS